ncbi:non-ribosomal peptide synthetase [Methylobacterium nonmethylotrophicum]|nr:non-ribosomal peptide synthetase [Methylobacterium nonmethylotrophicum]
MAETDRVAGREPAAREPSAAEDGGGERVRASDPFPLTDVQRAYWLGRSAAFDLGNIGCHIYAEMRIVPAALPQVEPAWRRLVQRHPMLRAVIRPDGLQEVRADVPPYRISHLDLTRAAPERAEAAIGAVRAEMSHRVYAAETWPLFELRTTATPAKVLLHFSLDLLVADFWSIQILLGELARLILDPGADLVPLTMTFADYLAAAEERRNGFRLERARRYWVDRLDTLPPAPRLPLARQPGTIARPVFRRTSLTVEPAAWAILKARAQAAGLTPTGVVMAAFARVVAAWSESRHFTLNLTLFNRAPLDPQVYGIVGDFTALLLLEVRDDPARGFLDFARALAAQFRTDLRHRAYDGIRLLQDIARRGDPDRPAAMPVVFTSALANSMPGLETTVEAGSVEYAVSQTPQVWIDHQVYERAGRLFLSFDAVEALFPAGLVEAMAAAYDALLHRLAADDAAWHANPDLVPAALRAPILAANRTEAPLPSGLLHLPFLEQARARPDALAVVTLERRLTYADLARRARGLAARLQALGVGPGRLVAVVMEKGWEQVVAVLAVLEAGAAYLPLDPDLPAARRNALMAEGGVGIVLTQPCLLPRLALPAQVSALALSWGEVGEPLCEAGRAVPGDLAYVIFTSGSTGQPKGVMIEHRSALNTVLDINARFGIGPGDRVLGLSSLSFDLSVYDIFGTLAAGATLVIPHATSAREPGDWDDLVRREGVTVWNSVPALYGLWLDRLEAEPGPVARTLRLALLSGDWVPLGLPARSRALLPGTRTISLGGATEASIWSIVHEIGALDPAWTSIPYGTALANQTMQVLDADLRPCPPWVRGEICIGGVGLARGYLNDPDKTAAKFVVSPHDGSRLYRTGDRGRHFPNGAIEFLGRDDGQVKLNGYRIELGEIEAVLARDPRVAQAAVTFERTPSGGRLAAFVAAPGLDPAEVAEIARATLPASMVPGLCRVLPALPLTPNGKIDRRALLRLLPPLDAAPAPAPVSAQAGEEEILLALVAGELARPDLAAADNLLALGATSLDLVRIVGRIEARFGIRPSFAAFFADPTVAALARTIAAESAANSAAHRRRAPLPANQNRPAAEPVLLDPAEREAFLRAEHGRRRCPEEWGRVALPPPAPADGPERRSVRSYLPDAVPLGTLGTWLGALARTAAGRRPYGSAGGTYAVQCYLHVRQGGVAGCPAGTFCYDPADHVLIPLTLGVDLSEEIHEPFANAPMARGAAVSVFLVGEPRAIEPLYGEMASRFLLLEAGAMGHALECAGARCGLGICAIGWLNFEPVRPLFLLDERQPLLHALVGGLAEGAIEEGVV